MPVVTQEDLENAQRDTQDLGLVVTGAADLDNPGHDDGTVTTRLGGDVKTLRRLFADIETEASDTIAATADATAEAIISGVAEQTAAAQRKFRWERLLAAFASGRIPRGKFDFEDYGIDDWDNPYNFILFWTGSALYPMANTEDPLFNWGWADGDILICEPDGTMWHSVSWVKVQDPTLDKSLTITHYHANYATGTDDTSGGRGASAGNPYKTTAFAIAQAKLADVPFNIYVYGDFVGLLGLSGATAMTIPDDLVGKLTFVPVNLTRTVWAPMREGMTAGMWAWTSPEAYVYRSVSTTSPINDAMKKTTAMWDGLNLDEQGCAQPLKYLGGVWVDEAEAQAAVAAIPGSFAWFGTTGAGLVLLVHLIDGREPDPVNWFLAETTLNTTWLIGEGAKLYIENLYRLAWDGGTNTAALRARPISVIDVFTRVVHTGEFWLYNCAATGASGPGIQMYDIARGGNEQCDVTWCYQDAENIHSFYATTAGGGDYMHIFTGWLRANNIGKTRFGNPLAETTSNQIVSAHDQARVTRFNVVGNNTMGACLYDVLGAQTWNVNVHVGDPIHGGAGSSPEVAIAVDGALAGPAGPDPAKVRLVHCSGKVPHDCSVFSATNGGDIEYAHQGGRTTATTSGAGSTVTDVLPA